MNSTYFNGLLRSLVVFSSLLITPLGYSQNTDVQSKVAQPGVQLSQVDVNVDTSPRRVYYDNDYRYRNARYYNGERVYPHRYHYHHHYDGYRGTYYDNGMVVRKSNVYYRGGRPAHACIITVNGRTYHGTRVAGGACRR